MKIDIKRYVAAFREGFAAVVRGYPVELALALYACVMWAICYETDSDTLVPRIALAPLFFVLALVVNHLAGRGPRRKVYWVSWLPLVPLSLWTGLEDWVESEPFLLTAGVLAPLAILLCRRAWDNGRFVAQAVLWLRSAMLALLFANVALGLFCAIFFSAVYIFGLDGGWVEDTAVYATILVESLAVPLLFLMMSDRWREARTRGSRVLEVLLDYIVTPAVLAYTVLLYLYLVKIVVTWSLPEGGVAYLVFFFTLALLGVKALQLLLDKRRYDWFFDRAGIVALPTQVLFWIGVMQRTNEYGLTVPRVYLVVCGALMTLAVALFLFRRTGRYLVVCMAAFVAFAALAYVPALEPERIAVRSQVGRAMRYADRLGIVDAEGRLTPQTMRADTLLREDYRGLYEALEYIAARDRAAFASFGLEDMEAVREAFPLTLRGYAVYGYDYEWADDESFSVSAEERAVSGVGNYNVYYPNIMNWSREAPSYRFANDTLRILLPERPAIRIPAEKLLGELLRRAQIDDPCPTASELTEKADLVTVYSDKELMLLFLSIRFDYEDNKLRISDLSLDGVFAK